MYIYIFQPPDKKNTAELKKYNPSFSLNLLKVHFTSFKIKKMYSMLICNDLCNKIKNIHSHACKSVRHETPSISEAIWTKWVG